MADRMNDPKPEKRSYGLVAVLAIFLLVMIVGNSKRSTTTPETLTTSSSPSSEDHSSSSLSGEEHSSHGLPPNQYVVKTQNGTFVFINQDAYHKVMMMRDGLIDGQYSAVLPYLSCIIGKGTHVVLLDYDYRLPEARVLDGTHAGCHGVIFKDHLEK